MSGLQSIDLESAAGERGVFNARQQNVAEPRTK